jgi:hypothetical protein
MSFAPAPGVKILTAAAQVRDIEAIESCTKKENGALNCPAEPGGECVPSGDPVFGSTAGLVTIGSDCTWGVCMPALKRRENQRIAIENLGKGRTIAELPGRGGAESYAFECQPVIQLACCSDGHPFRLRSAEHAAGPPRLIRRQAAVSGRRRGVAGGGSGGASRDAARLARRHRLPVGGRRHIRRVQGGESGGRGGRFRGSRLWR